VYCYAMLKFRGLVAYILMFMFVVATGVGVGLAWSLGAGLVAFGVTCGLVGYLLGAD
jgi:hypothetical protein